MIYKNIRIIKEIWLCGTVKYKLKTLKGVIIPVNEDLSSLKEAIEYVDSINLNDYTIQSKLF